MGVSDRTLKIESPAGPLALCRRDHALVLYYGAACPLCVVQTALTAARQEIQRLVQADHTRCGTCTKGRA